MLRFILSAAILLTCFGTTPLEANEQLAVTKGQKIAFLGDSITQAGARTNG